MKRTPAPPAREAATQMSKTILVLSLSVMVCAGVLADSHPASGLTLQEAREEALKAYWGVKIAQEEVTAAVAERKSRYANFFPQLVFDTNYSHANDETQVLLSKGGISKTPVPFPARDTLIPWLNQDTYQYGPALRQPIFLGGRLYFGYRQSQAKEEQTGWDKKKTVNDLLLSVEQIYANILQLQGESAVMKKSLEFFQKHREDLENKFKAGQVPIVDVLKAETEEAKTEGQLLAINNDLKVAEAQLNLLLGRKVTTAVSLEPLPDPSSVTIDLDTAWNLAKSYRPEVQEAIAASNAAGFSKRVVESTYFPQVDFTARWYGQEASPSDSETQHWQLLLTADWNLWEWGGTSQQVQKAAAQQRGAQDQVYLLADQANLEVYQAWLQIKAADALVEVLGKKKTHAQEVVRVTDLGFKAGVTTSSDMMAAENALSQVELEEVKAHFSALMARAAFHHAIGIMDEKISVSENAPPTGSSTTPQP
jgi:outer membrane protein